MSVALHHLVEGPPGRPVVLLLGSLGSDLSMWERQVPALAERFRVVRADHRGHGGSPVPPGPYALDDLVGDTLALLDSLGVRRAHVVGLSLGAMVGMRLAALHPSRVDRLALLCSSARMDPLMWAERAAAVRANGTASIAATVVGRWLTAAGRTTDLVARLEAMVAATSDEGYAGCCDAIREMDLRPDLGSIAAPTLCLAGEEDPTTPPDHLALVASAVPAARLQVLPRTAHMAAIESAGAVNAALLAHLDPAGTLAGRGEAVRREVLGDQYVDAVLDGASEFAAPLQEYLSAAAWGAVWARPGLGRRERSMVTVALLAALGHEKELAMHVRAARTNGVTEAELAEVLLHAAAYAGAPVGRRSFAVAEEALHPATSPPVPG